MSFSAAQLQSPRADRVNMRTIRRIVSPSPLWAVVVAALAAGCASTGATPKPFPMPSPPAAENVRNGDGLATADIKELIDDALHLRGTPYRNGGSEPSGFDCSGFTQWVFAKQGVAL